MTEIIKTVTTCPTCGSRCRVEGDDIEGTHYYVPVEKERAKVLVDEIEKFKEKLRKFVERQTELLVTGQTLESASKNWDSFPEAFSFDFTELFESLQKYKESEE